MVQELREESEIKLAEDALAKQATETENTSTLLNGRDVSDAAVRRVRALYDYSPMEDSPNVEKSQELHFVEGDVITVYGRPDNDGFLRVSTEWVGIVGGM